MAICYEDINFEWFVFKKYQINFNEIAEVLFTCSPFKTEFNLFLTFSTQFPVWCSVYWIKSMVICRSDLVRCTLGLALGEGVIDKLSGNSYCVAWVKI